MEVPVIDCSVADAAGEVNHKLLPGPNDLVIAVMGMTGVGKSTFISHLVEEEVPVGHDMRSHTKNFAIYSFDYTQNCRVFLVDTPGFNDTYLSDTKVLQNLAEFLSDMYHENGVKLAGIIQLHRITDNRLTRSALMNLQIFKKLCGEDAYKHIVLATTMWQSVQPGSQHEIALAREKELKEDPEFWKIMYERGSEVKRFLGIRDSAMEIIDLIAEKHRQFGNTTLQIQREMVDERKSLDETAAGQIAMQELNTIKAVHERNIQALEESHTAAIRDLDDLLADQFNRQLSKEREKLAKLEEDQNEMRKKYDDLIKEREKGEESSRRRNYFVWGQLGLGGLLLGTGLQTGNFTHMKNDLYVLFQSASSAVQNAV